MRRSLRCGLTGLAVVVLAVSGLSACKGDVNNGTGAGSGTLTIQGDAGNPTLVENFNPFLTATEMHGTNLIYEPLELRSPIDGSFAPYLATGHTFSGPTKLVFTLRQGVKWSDGQPFTVADVTFTFALLKKYPALDAAGIWAQVSAVTSTADTVTVTFKKPNVPFAGVVAATPIVPKHLWASVANPAKYANTKPIGTGPFILDQFAPTQYSLRKNPNNWESAKIAPSEVVFPAQSSNQSTNQLDVSGG